MVAAANGSDAATKICQANYFSGVVHYLNKDAKGARERWHKCVNCHKNDVNECVFAESLIKSLDSVANK